MANIVFPPRLKNAGQARVAALTIVAALLLPTGLHSEEARRVAPPALDESSPDSATETAVLAGGCFWGVQAVFQHVQGVRNALSGYAGGPRVAANYMTVSSGVTGHAEAVKIEFDPRQISYGKILQIYFSVAHDPTQLNRQGPDSGTQYRSAVFPVSVQQEKVAKAYIAQLDKSSQFARPVVTRIELGKTFYPAEAYHQDYLTLHPDSGYIIINDQPKLRNLERLFPEIYRAKPVLVGDGAAG